MRGQLLIPFLAVLLVIPMVAPAAVAQDATSDVAVDYHQSVLAQLSNVGRVRDAKVVTQMTATGDGPVQITATDAATKGLRNLDGFGKPAVSDSALTWDLDLAGTEKTRTIADFDKDLPLAVTVGYELDGETVRASRMRNRSGMVTVNYTIENTTASPTEVGFKDPEGNSVAETVDVVVPYVATLTLALPGAFRDIEAEGATIYGDGQGNTIVRWTMLLFEPLGESTAHVSVTARSRRGTVPGATLEAIPVSSESFASLASALDQYDDAEQDTQSLRNGARDLDRGAVRLAAGVSRLLDGLTQLADGSEELRDGLERARDGSRELADGVGLANAGGGELASGLGRLRGGAFELSDGMGRARAGGGELATGLGQLRDGSFALRDGTGQASRGSAELADGLGLLNAGAGDLSAGLGLLDTGGAQLAAGAQELRLGTTAAKDGAETILAGLEQIRDGLGLLADEDDGLPFAAAGAGQLRDGVAQIHGGLTTQIVPGLNTLAGVASQLAAPTGLPAAQQGVHDLHGGLTAGLTGLSTATDGQAAALGDALTNLCGGDPTASDECAVIGSAQGFLLAGIAPGLANLQAAIDGTIQPGVGLISIGLGNAIVGANALDANIPVLVGGTQAVADNLRSGDPTAPGVFEGLVGLTTGLEAAADGATQLFAGSGLAFGGQQQLVEGLTLLDGGASQLATGAGDLSLFLGQAADGGRQLHAGTGRAVDGANTLSNGLGQLFDGTQQLSSGARDAAAGAGQLSDGLVQLDDGGRQLAAGSRDAAAGAGQLSDGLGQLDDGSNQLADGLGDAADGSGRLADGLQLATVGGGQAADGAETLQETGTEVLLEKVSEGFSGRSELAAHLHAVDERGASEGLPYGAPEEANATAAYRFLIAGAADTGTAGDAGRGLAGVLLLLGAVALGGVARRRLLV